MNRIYLDLEDSETKKSPKIQISSQNGGQYFTRKKVLSRIYVKKASFLFTTDMEILLCWVLCYTQANV